MISQGATKITIFPYFLAVGLHVAEEIPEEIDKAKNIYPNVEFHTLPHLGVIDEMPNLILSQILKLLIMNIHHKTYGLYIIQIILIIMTHLFY